VVRVPARDAEYRGIAVGGPQRGTARIVATLVTGQRDTVLIRNQPRPATIVAESGDNQSARADSVLSQPLVARVTGGDTFGIEGVWVHFALTAGNGMLSDDSVRTDPDGRAAVRYTMARSFLSHVVTATTPRLSTGTTFTALFQSEPPATLEIVAGDGQTAIVGQAVAVAPQVRVLDANALAVAGATVTFSVTGGGGNVVGGTPITDTLGIATVGSWMLGAVGLNTLAAGADALGVTFTATGESGTGNVVWINPAGGDWSGGANWSTGVPPGPADTAVIDLPGTYTVTLDQTVGIERLMVGGPSGVQTLAHTANVLTVTGTAMFGLNAVYDLAGGAMATGAFTVAGSMTWTAGSLTGAGSLTNNGAMAISGAAAKTLGAGATLTNTGTIVHSGTGSLVLGLGEPVPL
jgi:hypothetical protein